MSLQFNTETESVEDIITLESRIEDQGSGKKVERNNGDHSDDALSKMARL